MPVPSAPPGSSRPGNAAPLRDGAAGKPAGATLRAGEADGFHDPGACGHLVAAV